LVVFDHEPAVPWGRVVLTESGKFEFQPMPETSLLAARSKAPNSKALNLAQI
jgi:hypothetical protein